MYMKYTVKSPGNGRNAESVLRRALDLSRRMCTHIRRHGECLRNGEHIRMIDPVAPGDCLEILTGDDYRYYVAHGRPPEAPIIPTVDHPSVCYQDAWMIVVDKPAGLTTHARFPGAEDALDHVLGLEVMHPVNRLDRLTSGLVLLGRNAHAHYRFSRTPLQRDYVALVHGRPAADHGRIDLPMARRPGSLIEREIAEDGQAAATRYQVLAVWDTPRITLMHFQLETGRTHQIRVHSQAMGFPLVGDTLYGAGCLRRAASPERLEPLRYRPEEAVITDALIDRQALHAFRLRFRDPFSDEERCFTAPLPDDIKKVLAQAGPPSAITESLRTLGLPEGGLVPDRAPRP